MIKPISADPDCKSPMTQLSKNDTDTRSHLTSDIKTYFLIMQINSKPEINVYLVGKFPVGISPKLGKSQMGMAVGKCPVGISPVGMAPDTL